MSVFNLGLHLTAKRQIINQMKRVGSLLPIALSVLLLSCATDNSKKETALKSIKVECAKPYTEGLNTHFMGKVVANEEINIAFRVAGTLESIPVKVGQAVRKGNVLAVLDRRDYETQLSATEAEHRQIKAEVERIIELYKRKSLPQNDYDKAVSALQQITAKLTAHRDALADCSLTASIDGKIQRVVYSVGETVGAGMPVVAMISSDDFEVEIFVSSTFYTNMEGTYSCRIPILTDKSYALKFVSIAPKANANGLYAVRLKIEGAENERIAAGMSCSVIIHKTPNADSLISIPLSAAFERNGESHVWVYKDETNQVSLRKVQIVKVSNKGEVVINEGVQSGEEVVVAGVLAIDEKMKLKKIPANAATNVGGLK